MAASAKLKEMRDLVSQLEGERTQRQTQWQGLANWLLPWRGLFDGQDGANTATDRVKNIINRAAPRAIVRAAAGITAGMTPQNLRWFKLAHRDPALAEKRGRRAYLDAVEDVFRSTLSSAGFYRHIFGFNEEWLGFGCGLLFMDNDPTTLIRFEACTAGTYAVALDERGMVSACSRRIKYSAHTLAQKYGKDAISSKSKRLLEKTPHKMVPCVHVVRPRAERDPQKIDSQNMPFESVMFEEGTRVEDVLGVGGYTEMPYFFAPFRDALDPYGVGPGDDAVGDAKQLQVLEKEKLIAIQKVSNPPTRKPSSYKNRLNVGPGGENLVGHAEGEGIKPLYEIRPDIAAIQQEIATVTARIEDATMASLFADLSLELRPKDMTASEYLERKRERMQLLGPSVSGYEQLVLSSMLVRLWSILDRAHMLPMPPQDAEEVEVIDIEFISPLSQAMSQTRAETTRAFLLDALNIAAVKPEALDKVDIDQALDEIAKGLGTPGSVIRSDEDVAKLREARAAAQQQAAQAEQMRAGMESLAKLGGTPSGPGTIAGDVMGKEGLPQ